MHAHDMKTIRGHLLGEVVSALQKAIRRGDERLACYFCMELFESRPRFDGYAWRRLLTISAEDCAGASITQEIWALHQAYELVKKRRKDPDRIFLAKAAIVLARALKSRDSDHASCLCYDLRVPGDETVALFIDEARAERADIPEYAFDVHTPKGKRAGKTKRDFFIEEHEALSPRVQGTFDDDLEAFRRGERGELPKR
jgi:replication-associated recombination protein RarA